jgi:hypothetical protein
MINRTSRCFQIFNPETLKLIKVTILRHNFVKLFIVKTLSKLVNTRAYLNFEQQLNFESKT